jgi:hypothetical protein
VQLVDRIEKRRFVGREFLLWLWFESELLDATLSTQKHGPFGLWLERTLVLSEGRESTRITAPMPGIGREAKEALLRGQLPESAGIRIAWNDDETSLVLKAETLGVASLKLQTVLGKAEATPNDLVAEMAGGARGKRPRSAEKKPDEQHEIFYERMNMAGEFEELLETLFGDFLSLRLAAAWEEIVVPLMRGWVDGEELEIAAYEALRRPKVRSVSEVRELKRQPASAQAADDTTSPLAEDAETLPLSPEQSDDEAEDDAREVAVAE